MTSLSKWKKEEPNQIKLKVTCLKKKKSKNAPVRWNK